MKMNMNLIHTIYGWRLLNRHEGVIHMPGGTKLPVSAVSRLQAFPLVSNADLSVLQKGRKNPAS